MAINPIRFNPMEFPENPRPVPIDFSAIGDIGRMYGQYRDRQEVGQLLRGAIDPKTGSLDLSKAATALAVSGRDPENYLRAATAQEGLRRGEAAQRALEAHYAEQARANAASERQRQQQLDQPTQTVVPPSLMNPGGAYSIPRDVTQPPTYRPFSPAAPAPTIPAPATPAPQSALPGGGPNLAEANPEQAPPYRVAGPPQPPPQQPAAAAPAPATQPAPAPVRNENFLRTLPAGGQELIKGLADYKLDPSKASREELAAVRTYRPDWDQSEYQKGANPPSAETQARLALAKSFIARAPGIKSRVEKGELTDIGGKALALVGQGGAGELRRAIEEGAEGLERLLTGAAMPASEAANYARRYTFDIKDTRETAIRKLNELENANRWMVTEVGQGRRTGENLLNGFRDKFGEDVTNKAGFDERSLAQYRTTPTAALSRAQKLLDAGADRGRVRDLLNQVDPSLPGKLGL